MKKYVLVVDDEEILRSMMTEVLEDQFEVVAVESGEECLKSLQGRTPDVLLLDVAMPGIDGIEVCKILREEPKTSSLPVFCISGLSNADDINKAKEAGADEYLVKPIDFDKLIRLIEKY